MGDGVDQVAGLATFVAPLPFLDPTEAARHAVRAAPRLPTVPELGVAPGAALARALGPVRGLATGGSEPRDAADVVLDEAAAAREASECPALQALLDQLDDGVWGVRVEQIGPVSLGLALRRAGLDPTAADGLARRCVSTRVDATLEVVRRSRRGTVVVVLREPGLVGSMHPTFALGPHEVDRQLAAVVSDIDRHRDGGLLIGVHVPGPADWPTIVASGVSLLSVPVTAGGPRADLVADFLDRGGCIAWGAVPVDRPLGTGEDLLWRELTNRWDELVGDGVDPVVLHRRSLVSTADGLGHFGESQARRALELLGALAERAAPSALGPVGG